METAFLMIVLTALSGEQTSAAFVSTGNKAACMKRAEPVKKILTMKKMQLKEIGCYVSQQKFTRFDHNAPKDAPRFTYLIHLNDKTAKITPATDLADCKTHLPATSDTGENGRIYCVTSAQKPTN